MNRRGVVLQRILALDPGRDHQEIVALDCCYEFPFDITRSLEFALFRTYACRAHRSYLMPPASSGALRRSVTMIPTSLSAR